MDALKIWFWNKGRQFGLILLEFLWKLVVRFFYQPDFIFLVYGQLRHKRACWSERTEKRIGLCGLISFIRWKKDGVRFRGLVIASTVSMEEFSERPELALRVVEEVKKRFPKVKAIALAGQLPGWIARASGQAPVTPCVGGSLGTCFAVGRAVFELSSSLRGVSDQHVVVVGGAGHTGSQVVEVLSVANRFRITAFDRRLSENVTGNVRQTSDPVCLESASLVVVLTAQGDEVRSLVPNIRRGTIVADDTHPMIGSRVRKALFDQGAKLAKITMTANPSLRMFPRLPDFKSDDIPGCLLEALVVSVRGREVLSSQSRFDAEAERLGFKPKLGDHPTYS